MPLFLYENYFLLLDLENVFGAETHALTRGPRLLVCGNVN